MAKHSKIKHHTKIKHHAKVNEDGPTKVVTNGDREGTGYDPGNDYESDPDFVQLKYEGFDVPKNAAKGTVVGTFANIEGMKIELLKDSNGRFAIVDGKLVVADGSTIDPNKAESHYVKVRFTDAKGVSHDYAYSVAVEIPRGPQGDWFIAKADQADVFTFDKMQTKTQGAAFVDGYKVGEDMFKIDHSVFKKLGAEGMLNKDFFTVGTKAKDKNDYLVYDKKEGALWYDADGSGKGAKVLIGVFADPVDLSHKDFLVI